MKMVASNTTIGVLISIIPFLWSTVLASESPQMVRFPGKSTRYASPDGVYVLINVDSETEQHAQQIGGSHILRLWNSVTGKHEVIYAYNRTVDTLWSPNGKRLLINDHAASDYSLALIFSVDHSTPIVDFAEEIRQSMKYNKTIFGNHHVYIEGTEWLDDDTVRIKVHGYGDANPSGFVLWYDYTIGAGFSQLKAGVTPFSR